MNMRRFLFYSMVLCVIFLVSGCGSNQPASSDENVGTIRIGIKNTEEQEILGTLAKILIEEKTDASAEVVLDDDVTSETLFEDLQNEDLDMYFDYSGSIGENALSMNEEEHSSSGEGVAMVFVELQNTLAGEYMMHLSNSVGYEGGLTIYITPQRREELNQISSFSELAEVSGDLVIGMPEGFKERVDGYAAMKEFYDFRFKDVKTYSEEEGFWALVHGEIDVMVGDTTSIYNSLYNLTLLSDDQRFFQPQITCYVVRNAVLDEYEGLEDSLSIMEGMLTSGNMSSMKRRVYYEGQDLESYLHDYLRARNLI